MTVPAKLWKVILVLPDENAEPTRRTRVIAIIMPNDQTVDFDWSKYRVSVAEVEKLTGHDFWPNLTCRPRQGPKSQSGRSTDSYPSSEERRVRVCTNNPLPLHSTRRSSHGEKEPHAHCFATSGQGISICQRVRSQAGAAPLAGKSGTLT